MREPGHPCGCRRCRTPVEVMRKAALHGDWHPVPTPLQTRCSPAGPERQSALNSRPLSVRCSTSTLSGPSTAIIWLHPDSRSFAVPPAPSARLAACTCGHEHGHGQYMAPACQHATMHTHSGTFGVSPSPHSPSCTRYTHSPRLLSLVCLSVCLCVCLSVPARRATCPPTAEQRACGHTRREACC